MENDVRHGDVTIHRIQKLPEGAKKIKHDGKFTVALGEATGHHHTLYANDMKVYEVNGTYLLHLPSPTPLRHQEHEEVIVPAGFWSVGFEQEYDPYLDEMRNVQD